MMDLCSQGDFAFAFALNTERILFQVGLTRQLPLVAISARVGSVLPRLTLMLAHYLMPLAVGLTWLMCARLHGH